jgi:hypothetical protein
MPICFKGADGTTRTLDSNEGPFFGIQAVRRDAQGLTGARDPGGDQQAVAQCSGAFIITILPSTIIGIDNAGGSKMLKDKKELGPPKRVKYGDNDCLLKPLLSPA